jgi:RNA polymerase sigma-70 factor (ECF subfamily)
MDQDNLNQRLSRISTKWTELFQAHHGPAEAVTAAQKLLVQRYCGAVYRYLLGAVRDPDVASDLCQEFALRFVRGDFRHAKPERGRFRSYVKTALIHLVDRYYHAQRAWPRQIADNAPEPVAPVPPGEDPERQFLDTWRQELLDRTWKALAEANPTYHAILLTRINQPELPSAQIAEEIGAKLGKVLTAVSVRKTIQRAHDKFADLLVEEVECSLENPSPPELAKELRELDLLKYCSAALEQRGR